MFVQLLLPELLWERKFSTAGEPRVSPEHLQHPPVSPSARIQADGRKRGRLLLQATEGRLSLPSLSVLFRFLVAGTAVVRVDAAPFVGGWGRCHLEPSSQRDGWCQR